MLVYWYLVITAQLLYGCWVGIEPVQSQNKHRVRIVRHNLPQQRLERVYGSLNNGNCTMLSGSSNPNNTCNGTSVLNDGIIPALDGGFSSNPTWASELFTLNGTRGIIRLSFEVASEDHDRVELAVFNCPQMGISLSSVEVYFDESFRPDRNDDNLGMLNIKSQPMATSCNRLKVFCVRYNITQPPTRFINLVIPNTNLDYVFLGEVTFLNGSSDPCVLEPVSTTQGSGADDTPSGTSTNNAGSSDIIGIIVAIVIVLVLVSVIVVVVVALLVILKTRKRKHESDKVHKLQSVVLETKEDEKEAESCMGNQYDIIDKPPQNGVKTAANSATTMDALYSNPDEAAITDDSYSHLRDNQKKIVPPERMAAISTEYSKLNRMRSQTDPIALKSMPSPAQQNPTDVDVGLVYAVPDKKKKVPKKSSKKAPAVPEKTAELVEYLDSKEAGVVGNGLDLPEYSEIDAGNNRSSGPVPLSSSASHSFAKKLDSNPIYHSTDIVPPQSHNGMFATDAIYSEPLPPNEHEPEWDPDQNIYEAIYSEPLQPSLFMQEREEIESEDLRPYTSIYTAPMVPTTNKPLSVSYRNIEEIRSLGNGNFGDVVLAQTIGLTPSQLRLEENVPNTLVAVKKLKENASERNRQLFEKEVTFMSRLDHPNVIRLLGVCIDEAVPFIMMEYMTNGDLNQYLQGFSMQSAGHEQKSNVKPVETSTLIYMCTQIASAMQYLASQNFIHRDLATRNCLVGLKDTIKVSDFGMSRSLYESQYYVVSGHAILPIRWMAAECFFGKFSAKTDVWAFGVTMWEIFTLAKEQPYYQLQDREVVEDAIRGPDRTLLEQPSKCPKDIYEIMKKCWIYDASQRPTFDELYTVLSQMSQ